MEAISTYLILFLINSWNQLLLRETAA